MLRGELLVALLELVADVVAVHGLIADDEANDIGRVRQLGARREVHRQEEAGVEEEGLQQRGSDLLLQRVIALVVRHDDLRFALKVLVFLRPAERIVDHRSRRQGHEDVGVRLRVHRLHEGDVGKDGLFVWRDGVGKQRYRTHRALDRIQERQSGEDAHGGLLFLLRQRLPAGDVIGHWNLFREPEVTRETVPHLGIFLIRDGIPVDRLHRSLVAGDIVVILVRHARYLVFLV